MHERNAKLEYLLKLDDEGETPVPTVPDWFLLGGAWSPVTCSSVHLLSSGDCNFVVLSQGRSSQKEMKSLQRVVFFCSVNTILEGGDPLHATCVPSSI